MNSKIDSFELSPIQISVWNLKIAEPFKSLFPIRDMVLAEIIDDMTANGFDGGHPIVVWNMTVVDGHTRLKAAITAGLETVPVVCRQFDDEDDALDYAIRCQRNRRNLTDGELLQCIQALDKRKGIGRPVTGCPLKRGKSADLMADALGISRGKIEKLRAIHDHGSEEIKEALRLGKYSINRAYQETMSPRRSAMPMEPDADAELVHSVMADIHGRMNTAQIRKLVKALQLELAIN